MKIQRTIAAILFSVAFLAWLTGAVLLYVVGVPMNISTDQDDPLVKAGRIKYMSRENYRTYDTIRGVLLVTGVIGCIGGSILLAQQKLHKRE